MRAFRPSGREQRVVFCRVVAEAGVVGEREVTEYTHVAGWTQLGDGGTTSPVTEAVIEGPMPAAVPAAVKATPKSAAREARKAARAAEKALIDSTRPFTQESTVRSWFETVFTLSVIGGLIAGALLVEPWWARAAFSVFAGLTIVRGFILYHDHMHNALLRHSKVAKAIFWWYGVLVLTPPKVWRQTHNYHHAHNSKVVGSHVGSYPILTVEMYLKATPLQRAMYRFTRHPLNIAIGYVTVFGFGMCVSPFLRRPKGNWDSIFALIFHVALVVTLVLVWGWGVAFYGLILPLMVACMLGGYLFYAQHNFEHMQVQPRHTWTFSRAALECSSYMELGPVMRWFTGNIGYHHVHHLNPRIPFYRLPEAMAAIPALQNPGKTTLWPWDIAKCFRCKLWDPDAETMVGYP
ncbi:MAG: fatty acid desaturase [Myxococcota bacterium]